MYGEFQQYADSVFGKVAWHEVHHVQAQLSEEAVGFARVEGLRGHLVVELGAVLNKIANSLL